jgi:hypothetical protein
VRDEHGWERECLVPEPLRTGVPEERRELPVEEHGKDIFGEGVEPAPRGTCLPITCSQPPTAASSTLMLRRMPAAFIRMSIRPNASRARAAAGIASASAMSQRSAAAPA